MKRKEKEAPESFASILDCLHSNQQQGEKSNNMHLSPLSFFFFKYSYLTTNWPLASHQSSTEVLKKVNNNKEM